jgi:hypothetical protein
MAATDLIKIRRQLSETTPGVGATQTNGVEELLPLGQVFTDTPASATQAGTVRQAAFVAAAAVPFADLTAAANSFNALRTALINAGIMAAS